MVFKEKLILSFVVFNILKFQDFRDIVTFLTLLAIGWVLFFFGITLVVASGFFDFRLRPIMDFLKHIS